MKNLNECQSIDQVFEYLKHTHNQLLELESMGLINCTTAIKLRDKAKYEAEILINTLC